MNGVEPEEEKLEIPEKRIPVIELFGPTIQGEGQVIGQQTFFLRLGGCDYRCKMCDSLHAVLPAEVKKNATWMTQEETFEAIIKKPLVHCKFITLSGGNPCMWSLDTLVSLLRQAGWRIAVETQGTIYQPWLNFCDYITISPKGPGMGEKFEPDKLDSLFSKLHYWPRLSLKVVLFDQRDIEFAKEISQRYKRTPLYLSLGNPTPPGSKDPALIPTELLDRMRMLWEEVKLEPMLSKAKFTPQLHLLLWGNERGR